MLSSGMFARHQTLAPARRPPARRGGPARPCASSVLSATSALSVFLPALLTIRPRMVTLRSAATKGRSTFIRAKLHPLFSYACALFHFPYTTFFPPSSLPSIPSALFPKTRGVGINSSQSGTRHTALTPLQLIQALSFHTLAHSFVQWAQHNPFGINRFRTLSIATGVVWVSLTKGSFRRCPGIGSSCLKAPVSRFASQMLFLAASRNLLVPPSVFLAKCDSFPAPSGSHIKRRRPLMSKPALKLFLGAALLTAALLLFAPLRTAAQTAKSSDSDRWIHVRIDNHESKGEMVRVNVPVERAEKVLPAINHDRLRNGKVKIDRAEMEGVDLRAILDAVRSSKDGEFVTVQNGDCDVRVAKQAGQLLIHVRDKGRGRTEKSAEKKSQVEIKIPMKVVDALFSAGKDELDLVAALHALSAQGDTELVAVKDDESTIRVWIDSKNSSD